MSRLNLFILLCFAAGCLGSEKVPETFTDPVNYLIQPGDLVVSNSGNRDVVLLDSNGTFKATLLNLGISDTPKGIAFNQATKEILVAVDGGDRVTGIAATDGAISDFINETTNLSGTLDGIAQLPGGDILIVETNAIERYSSSGVRITTGGWPRNHMTTNTQVTALSSGNYLVGSSGTDQARIYNNAGTQVFTTTSSGVAATTDIFGVIPLADGRNAIGWSGTTDTIQIRSADLATTAASFSNTTVLGNPKGMAQKPNGNLLIVDATANHIVEITLTGSLVDTYGEGINTPNHIFVVPDFD